MGIFDSIKNAFGKSEAEPDVTVAPSQMLRDAGIDPSGLKFGFATGVITVSGEIAEEANRQRIVEILSATPGIDRIEDNMTVAVPAPPEPEEPAAPATPEPAPAAAEETSPGESPAPEQSGRSYTVESGDTLWKIAEEMYGNGTKYMVIFEANKDLLENPDRIFPGQKLVIPDLGE
jgi:nucleoid-associated protein YgaU